jgi:polysaccharide export outer membrane protein
MHKSNRIKSLIVSSFLVLITFNSAYLKSQNMDSGLDKDYLQSLPEQIREDIEKESEKLDNIKGNSLKSRPSSELLKLEVVKDWENFKRAQLNNEMKSERYGLNLFRFMQSSFMPLNEPNFGSNYVLDYGDILEIQTFGNKSKKFEIEISRDGALNIPEIGTVTVAGLNFTQAVSLIINKYKNAFIGLDVIVTLKKIRDIKLLITGNVEFPGIYTLSGNSNALQALNISGGIKENGSLRDIEIKRNGKTIKYLDLYPSLIFGDISNITALQSGDAIFVKTAKNLVRAGSGFNNQAVFELNDNETLEDLIKFSGGVSRGVDNKFYNLISHDNGITKVIKLQNEDLASYVPKHLDSLSLPIDNFGYVEIKGEINRPGKYTITGNDTLYDLITRAGGYTKAAYSYGGNITTEKARKLEAEFIVKSYNEIIRFIAQNPSSFQEAGALPIILSEMKNFKPSGRVVAEFDLITLEKNPRKNILLNDKDSIYIPKNENNVYLYGDLANPTAVIFQDKYSLKDYISHAGGLNKYADKKHIYIVSPDGMAQVIDLSNFRALFPQDIDIYPGSLVYVPKKVGSVGGIDFYSKVAPVFSSLALSIASLNAITSD